MKNKNKIEKMKIINDLNLRKQARELGISVWRTPSFLFLVMGVTIMIAMAVTYFISKNYDSPELLALAECVVVAVIFIIGNSIIREVEQMARLNKMKSEFISVASHQLRTPLSAISWEVELLLDKQGAGLNDKQKMGLENISLLSARMKRLANDLMDVTRIDQNRLILKKEKINLTEIIEEVIKNASSLIKSKQITVNFNKDAKLPVILGDAEKIKLAIENLISNAVKYTLDRGKIEISLLKNGNSLVFRVKDNGVGIPDGQQQMVFNKFFRSDNVIKYQAEGTGLGLYIAKNIIEQSGGKIWFQSKEHAGTTFNFSMPIENLNE